jgi:hypothetical protein
MDLHIPDTEAWAALGTMTLISAGSFVRFIRWQKDVLTRTEHEAICTTNHNQVVKMLDDQNESTGEYRKLTIKNIDEIKGNVEAVKIDVGELKTDVAVLKATRPMTQVNVTGS